MSWSTVLTCHVTVMPDTSVFSKVLFTTNVAFFTLFEMPLTISCHIKQLVEHGSNYITV